MFYMIYQMERCPSTGTLHWQGYTRFKNTKRLSSVKNLLGNTVHLEFARGTEQDNKAYCSKDESRVEGEVPHEFGNFEPDAGHQGKRTDLEAVHALIDSGQTTRQIAQAETETFIRYHAGIERAVQLHRPVPPVRRDVVVSVIWGSTGVGKTHTVMMSTETESMYKVPEGPHPWDQYEDEKTIFLDEFRWENWPITTMNLVLDVWRLQLPARYNNKQASWTKVIICSNQDPRSWYPNEDPRLRDALRRRLGRGCRLMTERGQDLSAMEPNPDFTYLLPVAARPHPQTPPPQMIPPTPTQAIPPSEETIVVLDP